jgi:hypothetical protein
MFTVLFMLCAPLATADTIVSTFPWTPGGGWSVVGPQEPLGQPETDPACDFHIPSGTDYDNIIIDLPLDNWWGTTWTDVMIMSTDWSQYPPRPGTVLELRVVYAPGSAGVVRATYPSTLVLHADSTYWIALSTPANGLQSWNWSQDVYDYWCSYKTRSATWTTVWGQFCGFQVLGTPHVVDVPVTDGAGPLRLTSQPNPFIARATLAYRLEEEQGVTLRVFDVGGRLVRTCVAGEWRGPGEHRFVWDGTGSDGAGVGPGVYFAVLQAGRQVRTQRLVRLD